MFQTTNQLYKLASIDIMENKTAGDAMWLLWRIAGIPTHQMEMYGSHGPFTDGLPIKHEHVQWLCYFTSGKSAMLGTLSRNWE